MLDRQKLLLIKGRLNEALASMEKDFGVKLSVGNISYSDRNATFKVEAAEIDEGGEVCTKEASAFKALARLYGLEPDDLGREFMNSGRRDENVLHNCGDCGARPGQPHRDGCDVERCSVCGGQRLQCFLCPGHDKVWARWTGIWPGKAEADFLGMDLNDFNASDISHFNLGARTHADLFFIKPKGAVPERGLESYKKPATCILCGKGFESDAHDLYPGIELGGCAGYGSVHDGECVKVFVCDSCAVERKVLVDDKVVNRRL